MGSLDLLLDKPAIPRVLQILIDNMGEERHASLVEIIADTERAGSAIKALEAQGIVEREDGIVRVVRSEEASRRIEAIMRFYTGVDRTERRRLLFRGILNAAQYECLIHLDTFVGLMETEGFTRADAEAMFEKDKKEGFVEREQIVYKIRDGSPSRIFPFIPLYYYPHFISMKSDHPEQVRERMRRAGITLTEVEYLLGRYPKDIAAQAREYMGREKAHIRDRIKNEAFDIWWYYRF